MTGSARPGPSWPEWLHRWWLLRRVRPYTLVGGARLKSLYRQARQIEESGLPGDVVECGVFNGGTAALLAHFASRSPQPRTVWLFDSFQGMPAVTPEDGAASAEYVGKVRGEPRKVREVLSLVGAALERVRIVEGWFQETFRSVAIPRIALLHVDADWYESVRLCLETFYPSVVTGGIVILDDYGHWPGCRKAVDEFFSSRGIVPALHEVDYTARWHEKR